MRIWRDIPTQARLSGALSLPGRTSQRISAILALIATYHAVDKTLHVNLMPPAQQLRDIARACRARLQPGLYQAVTGSALAPGDAALLRQLERRALAKANYLDLLIAHYNVHDDELANPGVLWDRMLAGQQRDGGLIGMTPGNMLERADPAHRTLDVHLMDVDGQMTVLAAPVMQSILLRTWLHGVRDNAIDVPLWLWLENTDFCLEPEVAKAVLRVPYLNNDATHVYSIVRRQDDAFLSQGRMGATAYVWERFDTGWVTGAMSAKAGAEQSLAYVWNRHKELFAELHNPQPGAGREWEAFHHSSFTSGDLVLCAGMIAGKDGLITFLSNDSGHYRPSTAHLTKLVRHLYKRNLFDATAVVRDVAHAGQGDVPVLHILAPNYPAPQIPVQPAQIQPWHQAGPQQPGGGRAGVQMGRRG